MNYAVCGSINYVYLSMNKQGCGSIYYVHSSMMNQGCGYIYLGQESEEKLDYTMQFKIIVCILTILVFQSHIIWSDQVSCYIIAMIISLHSLYILTIFVFQSHIMWSNRVSQYAIVMINFKTKFMHVNTSNSCPTLQNFLCQNYIVLRVKIVNTVLN